MSGLREHAPYAAAAAAGLLLRFHTLGGQPLDAAEASASLAAWHAAAGASAPGTLLGPPVSAALFGLQAALFWITGSGDAVARMPAAIAGWLVVLLPWILRSALGRPFSIALAVLLALDPIAVGYARRADGAILSAAAAWTMILFAMGAQTPLIRRVRTFVLPVAAGLFVVSGPLAWDLLPPLVLFLIALIPVSARAATSSRPALVATTAALLVATAGFAHLHGAQYVSSGLTAWLDAWHASAGLSVGAWWSAVLRLEALPLAAGLAGAASIAVWPSAEGSPAPFDRRAATVLGFWALWGAALSLREGRELSVWLVLQPPLLLGAAALAGRPAVYRSPLALVAVTALAFAWVGAGVKVAAGRAPAFARAADGVSAMPSDQLLRWRLRADASGGSVDR